MTEQGRSARHALELKRIALLRRTLGQDGGTFDPTASPAADEPIPLLPAQERLFVLDQLYDTAGAYNIPIFARLRGDLDPEDVRAVFAQLLGRHDALRMSMSIVDGRPTQRAAADLELDFEFLDVAGAAGTSAVEVATHLAEREAARGFSLAHPPLWRVRLYRVGLGEYRVLVCLHHIIADGGSLAVLLEELAMGFAARRKGRAPALPAAPSFAAFARRARAETKERRANPDSLAYWRAQLGGAPTRLEIPRSPGIGATNRFEGRREAIEISSTTTEGLKRLAAESGGTLFMVLLAAFDVLLHQLSGQRSFLVAVPVANRRQVEAQRMVGFFVNTLLFRADLDPAGSFLELLARTKQAAVGAYEHQDVPFADLVEELNPERDLERQPLAQVMFVLQNTSIGAVDWGDVVLELLPLHNGTAKFDLLLDLHEERGGLTGYLETRSMVVGPGLGSQLSRRYVAILDDVAAGVVRALDSLGARSLHALPAPVAEADDTLHGRFERRAAERPEAIAVSFLGKHTTYGALDRRANRLARYLRARGIRRGDRVGVFLTRSPDLVATLLAAMKLGAAYVPLDPVYPAGRLGQILARAGCTVVITEPALAGSLPDGAPSALTPFADAELDRLDATPLGIPVSPDGVAYVVFTSGSTGAPKGVMAHHRGALDHLDHVRRAHALSAADVVLQTASVISDASIEDLLGPLLLGARVVLLPSPDAKDPAVWLETMDRERVTAILASTPRFLAELGRAARRAPGDRQSLRFVFVNGEPLTFEDVALARTGLGAGVTIVNQYGPTEAAVTQTEFRAGEGSPASGPVPLGEPCTGVEFLLLDERLRRVFPGTPGENHIGGVGLAHGYLGQPAQTAATFLPHPGPAAAGARIYRTGDRLAESTDHGFLFVGRVDHQVKIRGYRVEPAEVEAAIAAHPGVTSAVVVASVDEAKTERLIAYVTGIGEAERASLLAALKLQLPRYMIPAVVVPMATMPLLPNGKINRAALPPPPATRPSTAREAGPSDDLEAALPGLFEEVLAVEHVERNDNFFDLGGHSLAAIRLVSLISERLAIPVPVRSIFLNPSVAELAAHLESERAAPVGVRPAKVPLRATDARVRIHRTPLTDELRAGRVPPVDAISVSTLPNELLPLLEASAEGRLGREVEVASITETAWGRIASVWLPVPTREVYSEATLSRLGEALRLGVELGARAASLTGLLGSATRQGRDAVERAEALGLRLSITTGHATTVASVLLALEALTAATGRRIEDERVALVGVGSIGRAVAEAIALSERRPRELILSDVFARRDELLALTAALGAVAPGTPIRAAHAPAGELAEAAYRATLLIGATNAPEVVDVERLAPGTLIVDDSAPYFFEPRTLLRRMNDRRDVLATTGGILTSRRPLTRDLYLPDSIERIAREHGVEVPTGRAEVVPSCSFSALLAATEPELPPTIGPCTGRDALRHLAELKARELEAGALQISDRLIDAEIVHDFTRGYGNVRK